MFTVYDGFLYMGASFFAVPIWIGRAKKEIELVTGGSSLGCKPSLILNKTGKKVPSVVEIPTQ